MERSVHYVKGALWRIWNDYFTEKGQRVPPLHFLRRGADQDGFFVCDISLEVLKDFIYATQKSEIKSSLAGDWLLNSTDWYGEWAVFNAKAQTLSFRPERQRGRR